MCAVKEKGGGRGGRTGFVWSCNQTCLVYMSKFIQTRCVAHHWKQRGDKGERGAKCEGKESNEQYFFWHLILSLEHFIFALSGVIIDLHNSTVRECNGIIAIGCNLYIAETFSPKNEPLSFWTNNLHFSPEDKSLFLWPFFSLFISSEVFASPIKRLNSYRRDYNIVKMSLCPN